LILGKIKENWALSLGKVNVGGSPRSIEEGRHAKFCRKYYVGEWSPSSLSNGTM